MMIINKATLAGSALRVVGQFGCGYGFGYGFGFGSGFGFDLTLG